MGSGSSLTLELSRRFEEVDPLHVGVEEEVILLDPVVFLPVDAVEEVLRRVPGDGRFKAELRRAQLELVTAPAVRVADVVRGLVDARRTLVERLDGEIRFAAVGTHPSSSLVSAVTTRRRYRQISEELRWLVRPALPCGLHVHVAVSGAERSLAVYNALRSYLPEITALAANSPFFEGRDTGLASTRLRITEDNGRAGIPPAFACWRDYEEFVAWAARGGLVRDPSYHWWDLRLNPKHGTIEVRAPDAQTSIEAAAGITAFCQTLVASLADRYSAGKTLPVHDSCRIAENRWVAMRDGIEGDLVGLEDGVPRPTRERLRLLLDQLEPWACSLGCRAELELAYALAVENGAVRQRAVAAEIGVDALTGWVATETEASDITDAATILA